MKLSDRAAWAVAATLLAAVAWAPPAHAVADDAVNSAPLVLATKVVGKTVNAGPIHQISNCDGRLEQFRISDGNSSEHRWQGSPGGSFTGWNSLGGGFLYGDLDSARNGDCRLEVFAVGLNNEMYTTWQSNPNSGPWNYWTSIGGKLYSQPSAIILHGTIAVCAIGGDNAIWCNRHTQPHSSPWTGWYRL